MLFAAIVAELRARRRDVAEELLAPQIRVLKNQLAEALARAWEARQQVRVLQLENTRLVAALEKLADVRQDAHEDATSRGR